MNFCNLCTKHVIWIDLIVSLWGATLSTMEILKCEILGHVRSVCVMGTRNNVTVRRENALTARTMLQASTVRDVRMDGLEMLLHRDVNVSGFFSVLGCKKVILWTRWGLYYINSSGWLMLVGLKPVSIRMWPLPPRFYHWATDAKVTVVLIISFRFLSACNCDMNASNSTICDHENGQCECYPGVGNRICDACQENKYGYDNEDIFGEFSLVVKSR